MQSVFISICTDIWSELGMTASFLCVTAHFFTPDSNKYHSICIALKFRSPHTGVKIAELLQRMLLSGKYHVTNLEFLTTIEVTLLQLSKQTTMKLALLNLMVMSLIQIALH